MCGVDSTERETQQVVWIYFIGIMTNIISSVDSVEELCERNFSVLDVKPCHEVLDSRSGGVAIFIVVQYACHGYYNK